MTPIPQEKPCTYADLLEWEEDVRAEIIHGEIRMLSAPLRIHQKVLRKLFLKIGNYLEGKTCEIYSAPFDVRLFQEEDDTPCDVDTVVEPDISVICDPSKLDDTGCKGAPDLIIEILSPTTHRHDRLTKYNLYQRAGVQEYWIVDPDAQVVLVHTLEEGQYHSPVAYNAAATVPVGVLEGCSIELPPIFSGI